MLLNEHALIFGLSEIVRSAERSHTARMQGAFPNFPKYQFWDSSKSDKKSIRFQQRVPLINDFDFGYTSTYAICVPIDLHG